MVDKRTMHEPSIRIPMIVWYPGVFKEPRIIAQQVLTEDIAPSLLELCSAPPLDKVHGQSVVKLARSGLDRRWRHSWFYEYNYEKQFPYTPNVRGVRTDEWKYIHYPHGDGTPDRHLAELYDLKNDPGEERNLIADPARVKQLTELQQELARLMKATGLTPQADKMPLDEGVKTDLPDQRIR